jgi:hypothetical protein
MAVAMTLATRIGGKALTPNVPRTFSSEKNTPAMGALKAAEMPAADPHATKTRSRTGLDRKNRPMRDPSAAPATATGPSAPTLPPTPMARAAPAVFTATGMEWITPPRLTTARVTSGIFSPSESFVPCLTRSLVRERPAITTTAMERLPIPVRPPAAERASPWIRSMSL